jgi:hypothetical protein
VASSSSSSTTTETMKLSTPRISLQYIFISPTTASYLTYRVTLLLPRHVSVHLHHLEGSFFETRSPLYVTNTSNKNWVLYNKTDSKRLKFFTPFMLLLYCTKPNTLFDVFVTYNSERVPKNNPSRWCKCTETCRGSNTTTLRYLTCTWWRNKAVQQTENLLLLMLPRYSRSFWRRRAQGKLLVVELTALCVNKAQVTHSVLTSQRIHDDDDRKSRVWSHTFTRNK